MEVSNAEMEYLIEEVVRELKKRLNMEKEESNPDNNLLLITKLSTEDMVRSALLIGGTECSDRILQGLKRAKKVYLLEYGLEHRCKKEEMPKCLYQRYLSYEDTLIKCGCEIISDELQILPKDRISLEKASNPGTILNLTGHKVLRESDVYKARGSACSTLLLDRDAILTPLAKDFISSQNLEVRRQ